MNKKACLEFNSNIIVGNHNPGGYDIRFHFYRNSDRYYTIDTIEVQTDTIER